MLLKSKEKKDVSSKSSGDTYVAKQTVPDIQTSFKVKINKEIYPLPELVDKTKLDVKYPLIEPYSYVHIYWNSETNELLYELHEPELNGDERKVLDLLEKGIEELINISFLAIKNSDIVLAYLEKNMRVLIREFGIKITEKSFLKLMYYIYRDFVGMNEIDSLLNDYYIEDIECNGINSHVYIVHRKYSNLKTNIAYNDIKKLTNFVEKLAQKCGKYVSYASPLVDGTLPDGSRVSATYTQDITSRGPSFSIRKFTADPWTPVKLMQFRSVSPEILAYLWLLIGYEANILVIGGTGTGKTSFLNAISFFIPPQARIVSIEDTREINIRHDNWLPSVAREGIGASNILGKKHGEVTLFDLLKESFRQRPDYVIVGEIRGQEAFVLFQAMSSGHPSLSTMHAEDVETMVRRLETEPINLSASLVESLDSVCIMTQLKTEGRVARKVRSVVEILKVHERLGNVSTNTPFVWDPASDKFYFKSNSQIFDKLVTRFGINRAKLYTEFKRRSLLLMQMYRLDITGFKQVQDVINAYYKTPEIVLKRFGIK